MLVYPKRKYTLLTSSLHYQKMQRPSTQTADMWRDANDFLSTGANTLGRGMNQVASTVAGATSNVVESAAEMVVGVAAITPGLKTLVRPQVHRYIPSYSSLVIPCHPSSSLSSMIILVIPYHPSSFLIIHDHPVSFLAIPCYPPYPLRPLVPFSYAAIQ